MGRPVGRPRKVPVFAGPDDTSPPENGGNQPQLEDQEGDTSPPWSMDDAPLDGRALWLYPEDGDPVEAYWRETRKYAGGWIKHAFWALWKGSVPVAFEPVAWAPVA